MTKPTRHPIPIRATQILDPYPERLTNTNGVRQTTHLQPAQYLTRPPVPAATTHTSFAASLPTLRQQRRRWRAPITSTVLSIFGQGLLGASISYGTVDPTLGAMAAVGWMACGMLLIVAQCLSIARTETT